MQSTLLKRLNENFGTRIFFCLLSLIGLFGGMMTLLYIEVMHRSMEIDLANQGRTLSRFLASNARLGLFSRNSSQIRNTLQSVLDLEDIAWCGAYDPEGRPLYRESKPGRRQEDQVMPDAFYESLRGSVISAGSINGSDAVTFWSPVLAGSNQFSEEELFFDRTSEEAAADPLLLGFVSLTLDKTQVHESIRAMKAKILLLLLAFLLLSGIVAYFISQWVNRPLRQLVATVRGSSPGLDSASDLGLLRDSHAGMLAGLNDNFKTINQLKLGLEEKVAELEKEISERLAVEAALLKNQEKLKAISEEIADGVAIMDDGRHAWVNRAYCEISGYTAEELLGKGPELFLTPESGALVRQRMRDRMAGKPEPQVYLVNGFRKDGRLISLEVNARLVAYESGRAIQVIIRDVTARIQAEQERHDLEVKALSHSRLAVIGEIATGIAHEVNQPLTFIKIAFQAALRDLEGQGFSRGELQRNFKEALRQVERISAITDHLRSFGRPDVAGFEPVCLKQIFEDTMTLMGERLRLCNIALNRDIPESLPMVEGNPLQLEQVFINLLQNSVDALEGAEAGEILVRIALDGETVTINVADNGPGIDPAIREKIFKPFFTTKAAGKGTGLGLAIVNNIVTEHGGSVSWEPAFGWKCNIAARLPARLA